MKFPTVIPYEHNIIPTSLMAFKRNKAAEVNNTVLEYLERLGMSEEAKLEFRRRANCMEALGLCHSSWFHRFTVGLSQILHQILLPRPEIVLNEPPPPPPQHNTVEDEASSNAHGKRKRVGSPLRIRDRESNNIRPAHHHNNQVSPIELSDDSD